MVPFSSHCECYSRVNRIRQTCATSPTSHLPLIRSTGRNNSWTLNLFPSKHCRKTDNTSPRRGMDCKGRHKPRPDQTFTLRSKWGSPVSIASNLLQRKTYNIRAKNMHITLSAPKHSHLLDKVLTDICCKFRKISPLNKKKACKIQKFFKRRPDAYEWKHTSLLAIIQRQILPSGVVEVDEERSHRA